MRAERRLPKSLKKTLEFNREESSIFKLTGQGEESVRIADPPILLNSERIAIDQIQTKCCTERWEHPALPKEGCWLQAIVLVTSRDPYLNVTL